MNSIDPQIDAAVPLMKARAAQFDDRRGFLSLDDWIARDGATTVVYNLLLRAQKNCAAAAAEPPWPNRVQEHLVDAMNLSALVLSLLPEAAEHGGDHE
jgi:hypothetical protein